MVLKKKGCLELKNSLTVNIILYWPISTEHRQNYEPEQYTLFCIIILVKYIKSLEKKTTKTFIISNVGITFTFININDKSLQRNVGYRRDSRLLTSEKPVKITFPLSNKDTHLLPKPVLCNKTRFTVQLRCKKIKNKAKADNMKLSQKKESFRPISWQAQRNVFI